MLTDNYTPRQLPDFIGNPKIRFIEFDTKHPNGNEVRKLKITSHEKLTDLVIVIAKFKLPSYHVNDTIRFDFYAKGQLAQFVPQDLFFFESAE